MIENRRTFLQTAGLTLAAPFGPSAQVRARPNILFLFPDELRADWVEPSRLPVRTPNLKRLSDQGVRFTRAVTPSPLCAPARACLALGKEYDRCGVPGNNVNLPSGQTTFYQLLRSAGYHVMGCGKFDLHKPDRDWGTDGRKWIADWGFSDGINSEGKSDATLSFQRMGRPMGPYLAYLQSKGLLKTHVDDFGRRKGHNATFPTPLSDEDYCDNWIARNGLQLLDRAPSGQPWFLQVNFNGPHPPWDITRKMEKAWRGTAFPPPDGSGEYSAEEHNRIRQNYAAMIENIDRAAGRFLEKLKARGELDNTLVVFSSDHGEMLGDHNRWGKTFPHQPSVGIPLVFWGAGVRSGVVCPQPSTSLDLTATFLDYAGLPRPAEMDSRSLRPFLQEGKSDGLRSHVLSGLGKWRLAMDQRYKYIRGFEAEPLLFDHQNDPLENSNLAAANPEAASRLARLLPA